MTATVSRPKPPIIVSQRILPGYTGCTVTVITPSVDVVRGLTIKHKI